jgi:hypothetical protein
MLCNIARLWQTLPVFLTSIDHAWTNFLGQNAQDMAVDTDKAKLLMENLKNEVVAMTSVQRHSQTIPSIFSLLDMVAPTTSTWPRGKNNASC